MRPDNTAHLRAAARRRQEQTRSKAVRALRELGQSPRPVTFEAVARQAGISRSWLYTQPDIRGQIERLRSATCQVPGPPRPASQRASTQSLLVRLEAAATRNRKLAAENRQLRHQLALALGDQRSTLARPGEFDRGHA
jgi:hypothetical protein